MVNLMGISRNHLMGMTDGFIRPDTLVEGNEYLLIEHAGKESKLMLTTVRFVSYTSCPGFVVVSDGKGERMRCPRDDVFIYHDLEIINQLP